MTFFSCKALKWLQIINRECKVRSEKLNINRDGPSFYPCSILVNKGSGSCNNINDPYGKLCVPNVVKDINIKLLNFMSTNNEKIYIS